jgi:hypothetical protein
VPGGRAIAGVSALSTSDLGIADRRGETLVAETLVAGRWCAEKSRVADMMLILWS